MKTTMEIAPIFDNENGEVKISGRQLHMFLEVPTRYNDWFARMCEYGFAEGVDFYSNLSKTSELGGRPAIDHLMTLSMAKELAMLQRTNKGKEARRYFIRIDSERHKGTACGCARTDRARPTEGTLCGFGELKPYDNPDRGACEDHQAERCRHGAESSLSVDA